MGGFEFYILLAGMLLFFILWLLAAIDKDTRLEELAKWQRNYEELGTAHQKQSSLYAKTDSDLAGTRKSLVLEIEARMASEDATSILASVLCDLARKKRSKKKG